MSPPERDIVLEEDRPPPHCWFILVTPQALWHGHISVKSCETVGDLARAGPYDFPYLVFSLGGESLFFKIIKCNFGTIRPASLTCPWTVRRGGGSLPGGAVTLLTPLPCEGGARVRPSWALMCVSVHVP